MKQVPTYVQHPILVKHPELIDMITEARQDGATHIQVYSRNLAFFFRDHNENVELCVAKFSISERKFEWAWPANTWRDCEGIPDNATSIAEILNYVRPEPRRSNRLRLYLIVLKMTFMDLFHPIPRRYRVGQYNPNPKEEVPNGVIEKAYFKCSDCNDVFVSTAYLSGPFAETCKICSSHHIGAITEDEFFDSLVPYPIDPIYFPGSIVPGSQDLTSGIFDPDEDE